MTQLSDKLPVVAPANNIPGPKQGFWTYDDYAALPDDGNRYEILKGVYLGKAILPSQIVPGLPVPVEEFFVSAWEEPDK